MFAKHHTLKQLSVGVAVAASVAVVAVPSALGMTQAHRADGSGCSTLQSPGQGWVVVYDDQGVPTLEPTGQTSCTEALSCTPATAVAIRSPYPGWVIVTDDLGIPWLYPVGQTPSTASQECAQAQAAPAAGAKTEASVPAAPVMQSPYPGWVSVTDDGGDPWLYPVGQAGS
jgi:hypothetical protein